MRTQRSNIGRRRKVFKQAKAHISFTGKAVTANAGMAAVSRAFDASGIRDQLNTVSNAAYAPCKRSRSEASQSLFYYIVIFYNRKRRHSALGYQTRHEYDFSQIDFAQ